MPDPQQHGPSALLNIRGLGLFRALGRRLGRIERLNSSDDNSSASKDTPKEDTSDNTENSEIEKRLQGTEQSTADHSPKLKKKQVSLNLTDVSDSSSDKTCDSEGVAILTAVLRRLSLGNSSSTKKRTPQKSILRRPVCHVHVRGISGLPTQRVPVSRGYYKYPHRQNQMYYSH